MVLNPCLCHCWWKKNVRGVEGAGCEDKKRRWDRNSSKERMQLEKESETERSEGLENREVKRRWYCYLPGLEPPYRLLPPAFSSPWSSWWRTVTWLPLESRGWGKKSQETKHISTPLFQGKTRHKSKTTRLHVGHRLASIEHPHHAQRPTEANRSDWGSEKGKVSTSL